jgi:urease accessory protein
MPMHCPDPDGDRAATSTPSGWNARLALGFATRAGRTRLIERHQRGPLAVQRPFHPEGAPCHCYLLHPPGGVVGGDRLEIAVSVESGAHALLTTPGATKLYRSTGAEACQTQQLRVAVDGILEWLPHENILFAGTHARLSTQVDLDPGARFIGWEVQALGRPANGERLTTGTADLSLAIRRAGRPLLLDRLRIDAGAGLDGPAGLRGFAVTGTLVATGADREDLATVRERTAIDSRILWGATLLDDLLVVRCLAPFTEPARRLFAAIWGILRPRLLSLPACPPRIWGT